MTLCEFALTIIALKEGKVSPYLKGLMLMSANFELLYWTIRWKLTILLSSPISLLLDLGLLSSSDFSLFKKNEKRARLKKKCAIGVLHFLLRGI